MINNLKVTSMQMRLLGLKSDFTESTIWVQSICKAGLYYELSERKELDGQGYDKRGHRA